MNNFLNPGPVQILCRLILQSDPYHDGSEIRAAVDTVMNNPVYDAGPELLKACKSVSDGLTDSAVGEIEFENDDERFGALLLIGHLFKSRGKILEKAIAKAEGV